MRRRFKRWCKWMPVCRLPVRKLPVCKLPVYKLPVCKLSVRRLPDRWEKRKGRRGEKVWCVNRVNKQVISQREKNKRIGGRI
jgi:hypothetical protein